MSMRSTDTQARSYEFEVSIQAPREVVWRSLCEELDAWWLPDFHVVDPGSKLTFEARAGGQLVETSPSGAGLLWYTVAMVAPGTSLHLFGHVFPEWGGPGTSLLKLALEDDGAGTLLKVSESLVGAHTKAAARSQREGWTQLFEAGLKPHAEGAA